MTILFDADDTAENLLECWVSTLNRRHGTSVNKDEITEWDMTLAFPTLSPEEVFSPLYEDDFWKQVTPLPGCIEYLQRLIADGHELYMVTATDYRTCRAKIDRLLEIFPFLSQDHIIICNNKQMIRGDILIDDAPHNLIGGRYRKILMSAPHNRDFNAAAHDIYRANSWDAVYSIIKSFVMKDEVEKILFSFIPKDK